MSHDLVRPYFPSEIQLAESGEVPSEMQYLRVGKFSHPTYGEFEITPKTLAEMKSNFDQNVRRVDPAIDYFHESGKLAAGWPKKMVLKDGGKSLWFSDIDWTPRARQAIADKELRYFSPDFATQWTDPESGKVFHNVVFGGGLTNRPFVKDMEPITSLGEQIALADKEMQACIAGWIPELLNNGHSQNEALAIAYSKCGEKKLAEAQAETKKSQALKPEKNKSKGAYQMDEKDKKIAELEQEIAALKKKMSDEAKAEGDANVQMTAMKADNQKLCDEIKALRDKMELAEKENEFNIMLSEGKACVAQKEAFIKGDVKAFAKAAQPINLSEKGSAGGGKQDLTGDVQDKILKLAEEKTKADKSISLPQAVRLVLSENKELAEQYAREQA